MKLRFISLSALVLAIVSSGHGQSFTACIYNDGFPLRDHSTGSSPLPDGTQCVIYWDANSNGPDSADQPAPVCNNPPDCADGPPGTVYFNTFQLNSSTQGLDSGEFSLDRCFSSVRILPRPASYYIVVPTSSDSAWVSRVMTFVSGPQAPDLASATDWTWTSFQPILAAHFPHPTNNASNVPVNSTLSWVAGANAVSHDVYFGSTNPPPLIGNQQDTSYALGPLMECTTYYWRVDELDSSNTVPGQLWQFTTYGPTPPSLPTNPRPVQGATGIPLATELAWRAGDSTLFSAVYLGTLYPFSLVADSLTETHVVVSGLQANTTYYWTVQETNVCGTTGGPLWNFRTATSNDTRLPISGMPTAFTLSHAFPNPFNSSTRITFALPRATDISLRLYDVVGREVATLAEGPYQAGNHTVVFDGANLPSGIYFYSLNTRSGFHQTRKMVLLK